MKGQIVVVGILLALISGYIVFAGAMKGRELPELGNAPAFALIDSNGNGFNSESLKGRPWVASFFFASCQATCPTLMGTIASFLKRNHELGDFRVVSMSVDPSYDTPEILKKYAAKFSVDSKQWMLLTGDRSKVEDLIVNGFKVGTHEEPLLHSNRFLLFDQQGRLRGTYNGLEAEQVTALQSDLELVLASTR
ncbi:MAG: SCO family protein [Oligoflexia bacterium]|nr:SCO family protein [Oligoflexia bacterium]